MARLAFLCDFEAGHLLPSFDLALHLQKQGHEILYLVIEDNEVLVTSAGFPSVIIFPETYPPGTVDAYQKLSKSASEKQFFPHLLDLIDGAFDKTFADYKPDVVLVSYFLPLEALVLLYKYRVRLIIFNPSLRSNHDTPLSECAQSFMSLEGVLASSVLNYFTSVSSSTIRSLVDLFKPLDCVKELILCPKALDLPTNLFDDQHVMHIAPGIGAARRSLSEEVVRAGRTVIYLSFGSQVSLCRAQYKQLVLQALEVMKMAEASDWHLFVSLGNGFEVEEFEPLPGRVTMARWLPQLEILDEASVMITHGGLGTVKECVMAGVPMLVVPMMRDQPLNAERVLFHRLGLRLEIGECRGPRLLATLAEILRRPDLKEGLLNMRRLFMADHEKLVGIDLVA